MDKIILGNDGLKTVMRDYFAMEIISMTRIVFYLAIIFPMLANADTYLCISEAGAGVEHGGKSGIEANIFNVSNDKYILTNDGGNWVVKQLGKDFALFDYCHSQYFCESHIGYMGTFIREQNGIFTVITTTGILSGDLTISQAVVSKGRCSKIN